VSLGRAPEHEDLFRSTADFCDGQLSETSIYRLLHREGHRLFADDEFADLFKDIGRRSIPPRIVAVVMVLQRIEGLSDRDAVERFTFDARWKYAAGGLDFQYPGFVHTVLVDMRERLRRSERPDRIFETVLDVARKAGLVGRKRVLDSTALYDAVATQDTVTLIRSAIRGLLREADEELATQLRAVLKRDDDYNSPGKPACDWDDTAAREQLVDDLARDGYALLWAIDDRKLKGTVLQAAELLATVLGQDLEQRDDGVFRIARRVAPDRTISTVDPEARHGHKTSARGFDGYKGHGSIDPDSEIIVATTVTAGNAADGSVAKELLEEAFSNESPTQDEATEQPIEVYGDASYGTAEIIEHIENAGGEADVKVQSPSSAKGMFSKDAFEIDLDAGTVQCPAGQLIQIRMSKNAGGVAEFGSHCEGCTLRDKCTASKRGRTIRIHPKEQTLTRSRQRQKDPAWKARYRATRPKVERKLAHMMKHRHGGRRVRMRGRERIKHDFALLGAAVNLKRFATLGVHHNGQTWTR
jgi:hypothetical protein